MRVVLVTPDTSFYDADAEAVYLPAADGELGILARHAPLIAKLGHGVCRIQGLQGKDGQTPSLKTALYGGFVKVQSSRDEEFFAELERRGLSDYQRERVAAARQEMRQRGDDRAWVKQILIDRAVLDEKTLEEADKAASQATSVKNLVTILAFGAAAAAEGDSAEQAKRAADEARAALDQAKQAGAKGPELEEAEEAYLRAKAYADLLRSA